MHWKCVSLEKIELFFHIFYIYFRSKENEHPIVAKIYDSNFPKNKHYFGNFYDNDIDNFLRLLGQMIIL